MARVCIIGCGTAGEEAALEASHKGAEVTVVERRPYPEPPWRSWPALISGSARDSSPRAFRAVAPLTLAADVRTAGPGFVTLSDGRRLSFRLVLIATGTRFRPVSFPGARKAGVSVLDGPEKYEELARASASIDEALVTGEGFRALEVTDRLCCRGVKVRLLISCWERQPPSPIALSVIGDAARERGVELALEEVSRALGSGRVEAALVRGTVVPCDALVVTPPRRPNPVHSELRLGPGGGLEVDGHMRTSEPSVYAAGGCAELRGVRGSGPLTCIPSISGRIAGSNCAGSDHSIGGTVVDELHAFGLKWSRTGLFPCRSPLGRGVETVDRRWGPSSACSIAHERFTERVVGVEWVQPADSPPAGLPPLAPGLTLENLAYGLGSSDISPISETARLGLREWQRS